ncbi:Mu transposase C-terminal domain-containing protein [Chromobacterium piscinae]|uniref:Mu transposase C-terminal domain-containing protein n=1 Tax=Chromobacterium piscinae TaxID=686831 RepID=UPI003F7E8AE8
MSPLPPNASPATTTVSLRPFNTYPERTQEQAFRRKAYIDAWLSQEAPVFTVNFLEPLIAKVATNIGDSSPPSAATFYRWVSKYRSSGKDMTSLLPAYDKRGPHSRRLDEVTQAITQKVINEYYLTKQRLSIRAVQSRLRTAINRANADRSTENYLKIPSYDTLRRIIKEIDKYDADLARYGREYVNKKYRHSGFAELVTYLLERVEADHTPLNIFIRDDESLQVLGKPHITWMIDVMSRMIIGFYISFSPPNIRSVFECLKHAITPKDYIKEHYPDIEHDWPCYGIPHTLVVDNAFEFHAQDLTRATQELSITYQFCAPRRPWQKPFVERSFRTLAEQFASELPGHSFASYLERYGYDPEKECTVTFSELIHALHIWIIDIYAHTVHRGLNSTPYAVWKQYQDISQLRPMDATRLRLTLSQENTRVLGHSGIEIHGLRYNAPELLLLRKQYGDRLKVRVRYNTENLGLIYVLHPVTLEPIMVPCLQARYASDLSLFQHKKIQAHLRKEGGATSDPDALAQAREHMYATVGVLVRATKLKQRKKVARLKGLNSANLLGDLDTALGSTQPWSGEEWVAPINTERTPALIKVIKRADQLTKGGKK